VAANAGYTAEIIRDRLNKLLELFDTADTMTEQVRQIRFQQTSAVWPTEIPSVATFAAKYRSTLHGIEQQIADIRDGIEANRQALEDAFRSLNRADEEIETLLATIQQRLDAQPAPRPASHVQRAV
jgi:methyl-accepting chemotaxis protein